MLCCFSDSHATDVSGGGGLRAEARRYTLRRAEAQAEAACETDARPPRSTLFVNAACAGGQPVLFLDL